MLLYARVTLAKQIFMKNWYNLIPNGSLFNYNDLNLLLSKKFPNTLIQPTHFDKPDKFKAILTKNCSIVRCNVSNSKKYALYPNNLNEAADTLKLMIKAKEIDDIVEGFSLSNDGLWKWDVWGLISGNVIVGLGSCKLAYCGYSMQSRHANV